MGEYYSPCLTKLSGTNILRILFPSSFVGVVSCTYISNICRFFPRSRRHSKQISNNQSLPECMTSYSEISCTEYLIHDVSENTGFVTSRLLIPMMATAIFAETFIYIRLIPDIQGNSLNSNSEHLKICIPKFILLLTPQLTSFQCIRMPFFN